MRGLFRNIETLPRAVLQEHLHARTQTACSQPHGPTWVVSGAAGLHVAVRRVACVNGSLALQSWFVLALGPAAALAAVPDTIEEIDGETCRRDKSA